MAFFELNSEISIGEFRFSGVNGVIIKRSIRSIADTAVIKIPAKAKVINGNRSILDVTTSTQFADGDPVTIDLGYNYSMQTEFRGFVKLRSANMPLEIECEGYSWLLRRTKINQFYSSIAVKDLLKSIISTVDKRFSIYIQCTVDLVLHNFGLDNVSVFDAIGQISTATDNTLSCFFIEPDVLWCGLLYTVCATGKNPVNNGDVSYRPGFNMPKNTELRRQSPDNGVKVVYSKRLSKGSVISQSSDVSKDFDRVYEKILNHIQDPATLKILANEKAHQLNYSGYEGTLSAFLQPYSLPGYRVAIAKEDSEEIEGQYLLESTEVHFGAKGAQRKVELGPQIGHTNAK